MEFHWTWSTAWRGALESTDDPTGVTSFILEDPASPFGGRGLVVQEERVWEPTASVVNDLPTLTKTQAYDGQGRVMRTYWPSGATVDSFYYPNSLLKRQKLTPPSGGPTSFSTHYDAWKLPTEWETTGWDGVSPGARAGIVRNSKNQVAQLDWEVVGSLGSAVGDLTYGYGPDGLMLSRGARTYEHDDLRRILKNPATDELDPLGVPRRWQGVNFGPAVDFAEVPHRANVPYGYDAFGNLWQMPERNWELLYDGQQRLVLLEDHTVNGDFPAGTTTKTRFHYDVENGLLLEEQSRELPNQAQLRVGAAISFAGVHLRWDPNGGVWEWYEQVLPQVTLLNGTQERYVIKETFGQSVMVIDPVTGQVVADDKAGTHGGDDTGLVGTWPMDQLHGGLRDLTDGLMHSGARHYIVGDGRWLQPEPLLYLGLTNGNLEEPLGYGPTYARGNSNLWEDRSGESPLLLAQLATAVEKGPNYSAQDVLTNYAAIAATFGSPGPEDAVLGGVALAAKLGRGSKMVQRVVDAGKRLKAFTPFRKGCNCFVADTEVPSPMGGVPIDQIEVGDVVLAATTDAGEGPWRSVSEPGPGSGLVGEVACSVPQLVEPLTTHSLPSPPGCRAPTMALPDMEVVSVFDTRQARWRPGYAASIEPGDEFLRDGQLWLATSQEWQAQGDASVDDFWMADATASFNTPVRLPEAADWVLLLGDSGETGHRRLREVSGGERVAFGGWVFEVERDTLGLAVRRTGLVLSRVLDTFVRDSTAVVDASIAYDDGSLEVITGTPEHPFWVPKLQRWVPLGELVEGTELHVDSGAGAILVSSTWRQGDFTVYNFEVEGTHNYFVRAPGSESAAVLVHNTCPNAIRFTQASITDTFKDGRSVQKMIDGLVDGSIDPASVPAIRVFKQDGKLYSLDNRRLHAFQEAAKKNPDLQIPTREVDPAMYKREIGKKMNTRNDGESVDVYPTSD